MYKIARPPWLSTTIELAFVYLTCYCDHGHNVQFRHPGCLCAAASQSTTYLAPSGTQRELWRGGVLPGKTGHASLLYSGHSHIDGCPRRYLHLCRSTGTYQSIGASTGLTVQIISKELKGSAIETFWSGTSFLLCSTGMRQRQLSMPLLIRVQSSSQASRPSPTYSAGDRWF